MKSTSNFISKVIATLLCIAFFTTTIVSQLTLDDDEKKGCTYSVGKNCPKTCNDVPIWDNKCTK